MYIDGRLIKKLPETDEIIVQQHYTGMCYRTHISNVLKGTTITGVKFIHIKDAMKATFVAWDAKEILL